MSRKVITGFMLIRRKETYTEAMSSQRRPGGARCGVFSVCHRLEDYCWGVAGGKQNTRIRRRRQRAAIGRARLAVLRSVTSSCSAELFSVVVTIATANAEFVDITLHLHNHLCDTATRL